MTITIHKYSTGDRSTDTEILIRKITICITSVVGKPAGMVSTGVLLPAVPVEVELAWARTSMPLITSRTSSSSS